MSDDPEEFDGLLAAELAAYDPGDRHGPSEPIGAQTFNWRKLTPEDAPEKWEALRDWVEWFTVRYNIPVSVIPACWWKHGTLVEELSALHVAHDVAFDTSDTGFGPVSWHERLAIALPRLTRAYGGGCNTGHKPTKPRSWSAVTDEAEWNAWTTQAHAHRDTESVSQRKEEG